MILLELFSQPVDWKWSYKNSEEFGADFKVGEIPYQFYAYQNPHPSGSTLLRRNEAKKNSNYKHYKNWEVEFRIENSFAGKNLLNRYSLSNTGNASVVMGTVLEILKDFIKQNENKIDEIVFSAKESSRDKLYARMLKKMLPPKWKLETEHNRFDGTVFILLPN